MNRLALLAVLSLAACGTDSTLTIDNASSYALAEINLSPEDSTSWGADLLGSDVLLPGEALEVSGIQCGTYDIRIIDEDLDECILPSVDLCVDNAIWRISDLELAACQF